MRVLVCGGRDYSNSRLVQETLWDLDQTKGITAIIQGGCRGVDRIARDWCDKDTKCITVPALWHEHGKAAGPIRNQRMIDDFKPDLVVAFPGGRGTADMVRRAEIAGIPVMRVTDSSAEPRT